jgi:RNA polymerase sigma-70 factor (ECF subfamily)
MEHSDDNALKSATSIVARPPTIRLPSRRGSGGSSEARSLGALSRLADEPLMALVARDDPVAFAVLYRRHVHSAVALATQICRCRAVADEIVQEAFLSLWRSRRHFDGTRGSVRAWVLGIVRNRAIDVLRRNVAHQLARTSGRGVDDLLESDQRPDREVGLRERARELLAALEGLPPEQSHVLALAYYGGYTQTEIAEILDTPIGTVKGRTRLGLRKMAGAALDLR